ncbi:MAG TPA: type II CAAX endopeptidase family protein [Mycobacteriales bacterium]|nr:type II CAAX endopeptidase family protein [Mycobacteriales bacterium]
MAIALGGVLRLVTYLLARDTSIEPEALIRYDLLLTLGLYAAVSVLIVSQITPSVRLRWGEGSLPVRIGTGIALGAGLAGLLLALISSAAGHLQTDPRIVQLMSAGDATHIIVTAGLCCVIAPLVEETLFRGLLLESLRPRGTGLALVVSAALFSIWHLMPASFVYYVALGLTLGGLYLKRGLAGSIAAHAAFNTVLTVAAITVVLGPAHPMTVDGLSFVAPSGWSRAQVPNDQLGDGPFVLTGPDAASVDIVASPSAYAADPDEVVARIRSGALDSLGDFTVDRSAVREVTEPIGEVVEVPITAAGRSGSMVVFGANGEGYVLILLDAGSARARSDFAKLVDSLRFA